MNRDYKVPFYMLRIIVILVTFAFVKSEFKVGVLGTVGLLGLITMITNKAIQGPFVTESIKTE